MIAGSKVTDIYNSLNSR